MSYGRNWEGDGEADWADMGRWEVNSKRVILSVRGQRWLRDMEAALLALPDKRLARGLAEVRLEEDDFGERCETPLVCAVGALALYKGVPFDTLELDGSAEDTAEIATFLGMARTLAYVIGEENDKTFWHKVDRLRYYTNWVPPVVGGKRVHAVRNVQDYAFDHESPEDRYVRMLTWVRSKISEPATA